MSNDVTSLGSAGLPVASDRSWPRIRTLVEGVGRLAKHWIKRPFYSVYERYLQTKAHAWAKPRHIGVIMDGNRRFARFSGLGSSLSGHERGAAKLEEVLDWCYELEIPVVTVWCFSIENFERSAEEVQGLFDLFEDKTRQMVDAAEVHERQVRVRYIGKLELLPESLRHEIQRVEEATAGYEQFELNIAMAYGGREEIAEAFRRLLRDEAAAGRSAEEIAATLEPETLDRYVYTSGQPEPDLILRTSGEIRLSGFLLWQSAYSEFYFCESTWPAFRKIDFLRAIRAYDERQRRFGR